MSTTKGFGEFKLTGDFGISLPTETIVKIA